ncbi:hypothetical protein M9H77_02117 [Catharanthus roseus]|uniref:Uncharacterized protein n=1 Tax=Catharanthus roseus TaxID=4058 RepID=A0ACC0C7M8_CATRO|nr:hypothetical protein M9H77_02117 [Catharanthus roseus]
MPLQLTHTYICACYVCDCIKIDKNVVDYTSDKYDESNATQSSKKATKSYKSHVWIHARRLDIGKDGEPRIECIGCGKVYIAGGKYRTSSISCHIKMMWRECYQVDQIRCS